MGDSFDAEVDVVVVGSGAAGLAAATSAAQAGATVQLVEKGQQFGGATRWAIGSISAAGTRQQRQAGIEDSPEAHFEDMAKFRPMDVPELRWVLASEVGNTIAWLEEQGLVFTGPFPEPPHRVPRMHNVIPNAGAYLDRLSRAARAAGARLTTQTRVTELCTAGGGVEGVRVARGDQTRSIRARRGVILATGDFSGNAAMREEHFPPEVAAALPINPEADGSGHQIAMAVGAATREMGSLIAVKTRFPAPPNRVFIESLPTWTWLSHVERVALDRLPRALFRMIARQFLVTHMAPDPGLFRAGAILVNAEGARFCDEAQSTASLALQPGGSGYVVFDSRLADLFEEPEHPVSTAPGIAFANLRDYRRGRPDLYHTGDDVEALATAIGVDAEGLAGSVASAGLGPPFVALGPVYSRINVTEGSLAVDTEHRVLDTEGRVIPGLQAAGGIGQGGMILAGHGHHIGWATTSGRLAGQIAARH